MHSSLKFSQSFFTRRFKTEFEFNQNTNKNFIPSIAQSLLETLRENLLTGLTKTTLENFQGILEPGSNIFKLFTIRGLITLSSPQVPYELSLETAFKEYQGRHSTIYNLKEKRLNLPQSLPLEYISKTPGLIPHELTFSLEHLRSRAFIPLLGYFPTAEERFTLSVSPSLITFSMYAENLPDKKTIPFYDHPIFEKISEKLEQILQISIIREYQKKA